MRKTFCFTALLMGLTTLCFTVAQASEIMAWTTGGDADLSVFRELWAERMLVPGCLGLAVTAVALVLLVRLRGKGTRPDGYAGMLICGGGMLAVLPFLMAWRETLEAGSFKYNYSNYYSSVAYSSYIYNTALPKEDGYFDYFASYQWMAVLGAALIMAGIFAGGFAKRNLLREEEATEPETAPVPEEPAPQTQQTEWRIQLYCTVMDIRGDYALIKYDDTGVESEVAIALLPFGIDTGDRLKYENYEFSQI